MAENRKNQILSRVTGCGEKTKKTDHQEREASRT